MQFGNMVKSEYKRLVWLNLEIKENIQFKIFFPRTPYLALARTFQIIEEISGRLRTIEVLANFLRSVIVLSPSDLVACVYLSLNQLAPAYEGIEFFFILMDEYILFYEL